MKAADYVRKKILEDITKVMDELRDQGETELTLAPGYTIEEQYEVHLWHAACLKVALLARPEIADYSYGEKEDDDEEEDEFDGLFGEN